MGTFAVVPFGGGGLASGRGVARSAREFLVWIVFGVGFGARGATVASDPPFGVFVDGVPAVG